MKRNNTHIMPYYIEDQEYKVEFNYSPPVQGRFYMNNVDPGYPDEPAEFEILSVLDSNNVDVIELLSDKQIEDIDTYLYEKFDYDGE